MPLSFDGFPVDFALVIGHIDAERRVRIVIRDQTVVVLEFFRIVRVMRNVEIRDLISPS